MDEDTVEGTPPLSPFPELKLPLPPRLIIPESPEQINHNIFRSSPAQHTRAALEPLGKRVPRNTLKSNSVSLCALSRFVTGEPGFVEKAFRGEEHLKGYYMEDKDDRISWELQETRKALFQVSEGVVLPSGYTMWTDEQKKRVRYYLIEFVVNYRKADDETKEVKPSTMKSYILGIQQAFLADCGYDLKLLEGPIFNCRDEGLMSVIDNKFSVQQANGHFTESHNVLSTNDVKTLYRSSSLSREKPQGFQARLIFDVALVTAMCCTELVSLTTSQFRHVKKGEEMVWVVRGAVGSRLGASKTRAGGWNAVGQKPIEITIWNRDSLDGILNVYEDISDYMRVRHTMDCGSDRFFLGVNTKAVTFDNFFRRQHLGKNKFSCIVSNICKREGINGSRIKDGMTTHGLRGTVASLLLEAGHADSSVAMRTGHRDLRSLKNYQILAGGIGKKQQEDILGCVPKRRKTEPESPGKGQQVDVAVQYDDKENEGESSNSKQLQLLSDVKSISGGSFTINVNNHYR